MKYKDKEVKYIECWIGARYYEDGYITDNESGELVEDDNDNPRMPFVEGDNRSGGKYWHIKIDVDDGRIVDWPENISAFVHYKSCDDNIVHAINNKGEVIYDYEGYVPKILYMKDAESWGDYVILKISETGKLMDFNPDLEDLFNIQNFAHE